MAVGEENAMQVNDEAVLVHGRAQCDGCGENGPVVEMFTDSHDTNSITLCMDCLYYAQHTLRDRLGQAEGPL